MLLQPDVYTIDAHRSVVAESDTKLVTLTLLGDRLSDDPDPPKKGLNTIDGDDVSSKTTPKKPEV